MDYISKIHAMHWRHFAFADPISFEPGVNLLLGKNGSGKTSMLNLLQEASQRGNHKISSEAEALAVGTRLTTITLATEHEVVIAYEKRGANAGNWTENDLRDRIRVITSSRSVTSGNSVTNPFLNSLGLNTSDLGIGETIDVAEEFNKAIIRELVDVIKQKLDSDTDYLKGIQDEYQKGLVDFEKSLRIDPTKENAVFFFDHKGREVPINDLSSGEKEYLYFYAYLRRIRNDENKIVLIDEPELHLHSSQIRKLCELISFIALKNQVIIATHSGEILQHFLSKANLVLLSKEKVIKIENSEQMRQILKETGLPIDPSVFTAHWICAENDPASALHGAGPTTPEVLSWFFGGEIKKRYWSLGSNKTNSKIYEEGISSSAASPVQISITPVLDGDTLIKSPSSYFPTTIPEPKKELAYFPFWELENIFLIPAILNETIPSVEGQQGFERLWIAVESQKEKILGQIKKTAGKNVLRQFTLDQHIGPINVEEDIAEWKNKVQSAVVDFSPIKEKFDEILKTKNWRWLPGKEVLPYVLALEPKFWEKVRTLQQTNRLKELIATEGDIEVFRKKVLALE